MRQRARPTSPGRTRQRATARSRMPRSEADGVGARALSSPRPAWRDATDLPEAFCEPQIAVGARDDVLGVASRGGDRELGDRVRARRRDPPDLVPGDLDEPEVAVRP